MVDNTDKCKQNEENVDIVEQVNLFLAAKLFYNYKCP